jgi:hypothetical protein
VQVLERIEALEERERAPSLFTGVHRRRVLGTSGNALYRKSDFRRAYPHECG